LENLALFMTTNGGSANRGPALQQTFAMAKSYAEWSGLGAIGTPEACASQIERLWEQSNGGFGAYLMLAHNWANPQATARGYELIAREVMPQFQATRGPRWMLHSALGRFARSWRRRKLRRWKMPVTVISRRSPHAGEWSILITGSRTDTVRAGGCNDTMPRLDRAHSAMRMPTGV
jgi:hypothetical protein